MAEPLLHLTKWRARDDELRGERVADVVPPDAPQPDRSGLVYFANVPAGIVRMTATPVILGTPSSQGVYAVRPGAMTAYMWPTP